MTRLLVLAGVLVSLAASAPYLRDTLAGRTRPRAVSWAAWAALTASGAAAAASAGQVPAAALGSACAAACAVTAALALRYGTRQYGPLDIMCLAGAAAGLAVLAVTRSPGLAVLVTVVTDAVAYVPTAVHAWRAPGEETPGAYALYAAGAALALAAVPRPSAAGIAYPAYLLLANGTAAVMIAARRRSAVRLRTEACRR